MLIAADGLVIKSLGTDWSDGVKFAILFVNILLIVGLTIIDRNFTVIQKAANTRAAVLERIMNLELSEIITQRYRSAGLSGFATGLYSLFIVAVMFLSGFVLQTNGIYFALIIASGIIAIVILIGLRHYIKVSYPYGKIDWTIDRLQCTQKDKIGITLTNLDEKELSFEASENSPIILWEVREEGKKGSTYAGRGEIKENLSISPGDSYTWLWKTNNNGIYRVYRRTLTDSKLLPLKRKIRVQEKTADEAKPTLIKIVK